MEARGGEGQQEGRVQSLKEARAVEEARKEDLATEESALAAEASFRLAETECDEIEASHQARVKRIREIIDARSVEWSRSANAAEVIAQRKVSDVQMLKDRLVVQFRGDVEQ